MVHVYSVISSIKRSSKYTVFIVLGLLLLVWWIETPAGILGKADAVGYAVCHRLDLRSFHIGIRQLPLCARCTGQYVGAMLGLLFQAVFARKRVGFPPKRVVAILGLLSLAFVIDGLNSYLYLPPFPDIFPHLPHLYAPSNTLRLLTGTGMGLVVAMLIYPAFVGSIYAHPDPRPAMSGIKLSSGLIILGIVTDLLILTGSQHVLYIAALTSAAGVIVLLSIAYTTVIIRLLKKENTYNSISQISLPAGIGFLLSMSQIALIDLLRLIMTGTWTGLIFG